MLEKHELLLEISVKDINSISELRAIGYQLISGIGRKRIRAGDPEYVDRAISYLEADPYFGGSDYCKSYLVRYLKLNPFDRSHRQRLQTLILRIIDEYGPFGGRHLRRLAASVQSPEFLDHVRERLKSIDPQIRRRASAVHDYVQ